MDYYYPITLQTRFQIGHAVHDKFELAFKYGEFPLKFHWDGTHLPERSFDILGHIDIVDTNIYDIKTCYTFANIPKTLHKYQILIYVILYEKQMHRRLDAYIWYVNLVSCEHFVVKVDFEDLFTKMINTCTEAHNYLIGASKTITRNRQKDCKSMCPVVAWCNIFSKQYDLE